MGRTSPVRDSRRAVLRFSYCRSVGRLWAMPPLYIPCCSVHYSFQVEPAAGLHWGAQPS